MARVVIIGAGISGLSLAWYLKALKPQWECLILEASSRVGGKAWTVLEDGFLCEKGVNGFLNNKPSSLALAAELKLPLYPANENSKRRFVVKAGRLVKLPEKPQEFLFSSLLSPVGRLRVLLEPFIAKNTSPEDESLASFARRRLGEEAFQHLIDPMAKGIYAGDPELLSLRYCFPRIFELEQTYGSLIKAMLALKKQAAKQGKKGPGAGPGGHLTSFEMGMSQLTDSLANHLQGHIKLDAEAVELFKATASGQWRITTRKGETIDATHVVMACPARTAASLIAPHSPALSAALNKIDYPPVTVAALGFSQGLLKHPLNGFGFLVPEKERRSILGVLWDSSIFPNRAPEGYSLLRILVGGARARELAYLKDNDLLNRVKKELQELMGIHAAPEFVRIFRWDEAIPQYNIGYGNLLSCLQQEAKHLPNIHMRCNWIGGVSFNDCIANSQDLAKKLAAI